MNLPAPTDGLIAPHYAPSIQPPLPSQQPGPDPSQLNPPVTRFNNTRHPEPSNNVDPSPITASNIPRNSLQNVNPPSQPFLMHGQIPSWDCIWPLLIPPMPDRSAHHSPTSQNTQAASTCPTCPTQPTSGPVPFGGGRPAPAVQDPTAPLAATAPSSSSPYPNPTAPHTAPQVSEATLFRPGVADAGPTTANGYARRSKRARLRRAREVPLVRIEDRIEWVSRDVMKMTLWFNWSPDAEAEAHEPWE
jgi:hypothetical protein